jgi:hypothetical protein
MRWLSSLAIVGLVVAAGARSSDACVCAKSEGLDADFRDADAVFVGRVTALEIRTPPGGDGQDANTVATFKVERRWKGPATERIRVATCGTQEIICTCGSDFLLGGRYIVFATGKVLSTGSCGRTQRLGFKIRGHPELDWAGVEDLVKQLDAIMAAQGRSGTVRR